MVLILYPVALLNLYSFFFLVGVCVFFRVLYAREKDVIGGV